MPHQLIFRAFSDTFKLQIDLNADEFIETIEPFKLKLVGARYFSYELGCSYITQIPWTNSFEENYEPHLDSIPITSATSQPAYWRCKLNFEDFCLIRSMAALFSFLIFDKEINSESSTSSTPSVPFREETEAVRFDQKQIETMLQEFPVNDISYLELDGRMRLESHVFSFLQIFETENHPSAHGIGKPKEGLSLFTCLNRCQSNIGKKLLKQWMSSPLCDPYLINNRLDDVGALWKLFDSSNFEGGAQQVSSIESILSHHLNGIRDLRPIFSRLQVGSSTINDWNYLRKFCISCLGIKQSLDLLIKNIYRSSLLTNGYQQLPLTANSIIKRIDEMNSQALDDMQEAIFNTIELDVQQLQRSSYDISSITIKPGVDEELDRLIEDLSSLDSFLDRVANMEIAKFKSIPSLRVMYLPQMGFQVAIPITSQFGLQEIWNSLAEHFSNHDEREINDENNMAEQENLNAGDPASEKPNAVVQFVTKNYVYLKTRTTFEIDELLGDLMPKISDKQLLIIRKISSSILSFMPLLLSWSELMAEFDVLRSFMLISKEHQYTRPIITDPVSNITNQPLQPSSSLAEDTSTIHIEHGRHPLLERVLETSRAAISSNFCVPNNFSASSLLEILQNPSNSDDTMDGEPSTQANTGSQFPKPVQILFGPNNSGKSVYITQVGLIVYMAHIGCFVPAKAAKICVVDQIFCFSNSSTCSVPISRLTLSNSRSSNDKDGSTGFVQQKTLTSVGSGSGSFMNAVMLAGRILNNATPLSLVLIDEFGMGSTEIDGCSLISAMINHFCTKEQISSFDVSNNPIELLAFPKVLVSTHLPIIPCIVKTPNIQNNAQLLTMKYVLSNRPFIYDDVNTHDLDRSAESIASLRNDPVFLYKVEPLTEEYILFNTSTDNRQEGTDCRGGDPSAASFGISCAKQAGIESSIIIRASQIRENYKNSIRSGPIGEFIDQPHQSTNQNEAETFSDDQINSINNLLDLLVDNFGIQDSLKDSDFSPDEFLRMVPSEMDMELS